MLTLTSEQLGVWNAEGHLCWEREVDSSRGRFGEGADGTPWLATPGSVYLLDLEGESLARFDGTAPVGCDAAELTLHYSRFVQRVRRADGRRVAKFLNRLPKMVERRFEGLSADGRVAVHANGESGRLDVIDAVTGESTGGFDFDGGAYARLPSSVLHPDASRLAAASVDGVSILDVATGDVIARLEGPMAGCVGSAAGIVVMFPSHTELVGWDGEALGSMRGKWIKKSLYELLALSPDGGRLLCREKRGATLRNPVDGSPIECKPLPRPAADPPPAAEPGTLRIPNDVGPIRGVGRAGERLVLELEGHRVQLRSPDGATRIAQARGKPPHEGVFAAHDALWRWSMGALQVVTPDGKTETLMKPELLGNAGGAGNRLLVLARNHDGNASAIYDTDTRTPTPVKMRVSDNRQRVFLAPSARYAVGWEKLREIAVYPKCASRAKVRHKHEDYGLHMLRFSSSGERFAYITDWWRLYAWNAEGKEPARRYDTLAELPIRALAYDDETLWVAAGDGLFRIGEDGEPTLQTEPGPITSFVVDGDQCLCVLDGGLIAVDCRV